MKSRLSPKATTELVILGFAINIIMVYIAGKTGIPFYLDAIGTILAASLGGILPGITVGFFSNVINYLFSVSPDPLTMYYGIVSILLAAVTVILVRKGMFRSLKRFALSVMVLAAVGGGMGSVMTWFLYGLDFGENVSSQFVLQVYNTLQCRPFTAELLGDVIIDLADKTVDASIVFVLLKLLPKSWISKLPMRDCYLPEAAEENEALGTIEQCRGMSMKTKLTIVVVTASLLLGISATGVGLYMQKDDRLKAYAENSNTIAATVAQLIDGDSVPEYLATGSKGSEYARIQSEIKALKNNVEATEGIEVVCMKDGKRETLFKTDGAEILSEVSESFETEAIDSETVTIRDDQSLVTIRPVYDSSGTIAAYVAAKLSLANLRNDLYIYFIRTFSLLFGIGVLIVAYLFRYYEKSILNPMQILLLQTREVGAKKKKGDRLRDRVQVKTGDELENLFRAMCEAEDDVIRSDSASKSKTQFLSKLSHEIRTPLNSVIGFSKLAVQEKDTITREELMDYMQRIEISGGYLLALVSDVLDISRIEEGRMVVHNEPCRLDDIITETTDAFYGQMKAKNIEFVVDRDYPDVILSMDESHTIQILNNLISNACKYTEEGGTAGLEVHAEPDGAGQMKVTFIVQDTGIGMSPEFCEKIFEPFTQDKRGTKMKNQLRGSGLGMSICKNLVELLNGTITLESEVGEGSCFTVTINYELIGDAEKTESAASDDYSVLRGKKILVADDLEMNRFVVEKMLAAYGFEFTDAEDGREAVDIYAASQPGEYFAIFMDVQMQDMNGLEATEKIRSMEEPYRNIPILGMTADAFSDDVKKCKESGMNYHITKPVQQEKIMNALMEIYNNSLSEG